MPLTYAECAKLNHHPTCAWHTEGHCDCGAIANHFEARAVAVEAELALLREAKVAAGGLTSTPPPAQGWAIHEIVGVVVVNKWGFGWRGALRRAWLWLRSRR